MNNEELQRQIEELTNRVSELEQAQNLNAFQSFMDLVYNNSKVVSASVVAADKDSAVTLAKSIPSFGTYSFLDFPDKFFVVKYNSATYYLPLYLASRF